MAESVERSKRGSQVLIRHTRVRYCIVGLILLLASSLQSAAGQTSERVVSARGVASVDAVRVGDRFKLGVVIQIDDGYHVNAHVPTLEYLIPTDVKFQAPPGIVVEDAKYPPSEKLTFEFEKDTPIAVYGGTTIITAEARVEEGVDPASRAINAAVEVQACNDTQCLAPATLHLAIPIRFAAPGETIREANQELFARAEAAGFDSPAGTLMQFGGEAGRGDPISELISSQGIVVALLSVFLAGLLLNATPCVYPIIPITIGFFMNQGSREGARLRRTFFMASMYVLGMAITYSVLGVIASMTKGLFGAALQNPLVLAFLAALMVLLALSMFGVYEFRLPDALNRFATRSTQSTSGLIGALVMGLTMGIVAAPCIGPFVLGLLVHVGAAGDPVYGFFMFFVLAIGLGLPYLVLGTFSGGLRALPRSGEWMVTVRKVFGVVLIGMALYFLMPVMGNYATPVFIAFFALAALYFIVWEAPRTKPAPFSWVLRAIGIGAAVIAVVMAVPRQAETGIEWAPYSEQALALARTEGKGVIIDAFADWCIPCKELDQFTFTDRDVKSEAERFVTLKLDLTRNDPESETGRARQRFDILGVPTIVFIDPAGRERADLRLEGFERPGPFLARMTKIESAPASGPEDAVFASDNGVQPSAVSGTGGNGAYPLAPSAIFVRLDGGTLTLDSMRGKVVLVDFWATWCVPCISEIPMFNDLHDEYGSRGFEMIGVSLDEEGASIVKPFMKRYPMKYTVVVGDDESARAFGVAESSLPVAFLIDKQGRIRFKHIGITEREVFEKEIRELLAE